MRQQQPAGQEAGRGLLHAGYVMSGGTELRHGLGRLQRDNRLRDVPDRGHLYRRNVLHAELPPQQQLRRRRLRRELRDMHRTGDMYRHIREPDLRR